MENKEKNFYKLYLKYKLKYLSLKKNINGGAYPISEKIMPGLSFGTSSVGSSINLKNYLNDALNIGYRHIDIKQRYANILNMELEEYLNIIKEEIQNVPRDKLWITWLGILPIELVIEKLDCQYIDTVLSPKNFNEEYILELKSKPELVKNIGIENIYDFNIINELKEKYNINTLQIQAKLEHDELIQNCNSIGVKVQLYAINSPIWNAQIFDNTIPENAIDRNMLAKYFMNKYIPNGNTIIVSSLTGSSIIPNFENFNSLILGETIITPDEILTIEENLKKYNQFIKYMGN